ncbi:MAG: hypothetical protein ABSG82_07485 [Sedimentisphaerales bacterium]|jgi:hypothetical protein
MRYLLAAALLLAFISSTQVNAESAVDTTFDVNRPGLGDQKTITATAGENGSIAPQGVITADYDGVITFNAEPNTGYAVDAWYLDGNSVQLGGRSYDLSSIEANHTVRVTFEPLQFTISGTITYGGSGIDGVHLGGLGVVTNAAGFYTATVDYGWSGVVTPTKSGYTFDPNSRSYIDITADNEDGDYYAMPAGDANDHKQHNIQRSKVK